MVILFGLLSGCGPLTGANKDNQYDWGDENVTGNDSEPYAMLTKENKRKIKKIREANRKLVARYYSTLPDELKQMRGVTPSTCGGTRHNFGIRKGPENVAHIELNLFFVIDKALGSRGQEALSQVKSCFGPAIEMWSRNGVELVIKSQSGSTTQWTAIPYSVIEDTNLVRI